MQCVLCRSLKWLLSRYDLGWIEAADELRFKALNTNALFEADADSARLRRNYELWHSNPSEAFSEFLLLAEGGSVWSMIQVGGAYECGKGTPVDRLRAEDWYWKALERGSDFALLRASCLALRRGDAAKAKAILGVGVARGLTPAMRSLAWIELRLSKYKDARRRAYALYERAIELGDGSARIDLARAMALGCFGWRAIPAGIRSLPAAVEQISAQIGAKSDARTRT